MDFATAHDCYFIPQVVGTDENGLPLPSPLGWDRRSWVFASRSDPGEASADAADSTPRQG